MKLGIKGSGPEHAPGAPLAALSAGAVIGGRYRIQALLGQGGMGLVYAAVHEHTGRAVAVKLIHCPWQDDELQLSERFLGEARTAAALRHPNIVDVLDLGFLGAAPYLVMERLQGESLEDLLQRLEILPLESALAWLLPVMGALAALHEKGIVHRDVKPSNIFLSRDEGQRVLPKLLDFGLARATRDVPLTQPGVTLGTPEYMAPERARGEAVGPSADVWSMGVVAFECLCGRSPFTATTLNGLAAQIVSGEVLRAQEANPRLPSAIAAVIDHALQNAPEQRHPDMAHFARALGAAALSEGLSVPPDPDPIGLPNFSALHLRGNAWASGPMAKLFSVANEAQRAASSSSARASTRNDAPARQRSQRRLVLLALSLVALAAGGTFAWKTRLLDDPSAAPSPATPARSTRDALRSSSVREASPPEPESSEPLRAEPSPVRPAMSAREPTPRRQEPETTKRRGRRAAQRKEAQQADDAIVHGASEFEEEWK